MTLLRQPAAAQTTAAPPGSDVDANRVALLLTRITGWLIVLAAAMVAAALIVAIRLDILGLRLPLLLWPLAVAGLVAAVVALVRSTSIGVISAALGALVVVWAFGGLAAHFHGETGTRTIVVTSDDELQEHYHLGAGWLTLDLAQLELDEPVRVEVETRAGRVDVVVPDDAVIDVTSHVWAGRSNLLGDFVEGFRVRDRTDEPAARSTAVLTLDVDVGLGEARVCRAAQARPDHRCQG